LIIAFASLVAPKIAVSIHNMFINISSENFILQNSIEPLSKNLLTKLFGAAKLFGAGNLHCATKLFVVSLNSDQTSKASCVQYSISSSNTWLISYEQMNKQKHLSLLLLYVKVIFKN